MKISSTTKPAKLPSDDLVKKFFLDFLDTFFARRDLSSLKKMLAPKFSSIGTAKHEIAASSKEALKFFKAKIEQVSGQVKTACDNLIVKKISDDTALVFGSFSLIGKADDTDFVIPQTRITAVISLIANEMKFSHFHVSVPQENIGEPNYPFRCMTDAFHETEQKYRLVFENAPVGILQFDRQGIIRACNNKFLQIMNSTSEKILGLDMLHLKDKKASEAVRQALDGKVAYYNGYYQATTSNVVPPLRAILTPMLDSNGTLIGGIGIYEDMSEFKDTENRLQYHFSFERLVANISTSFVNANANEIDNVIENALKLSCQFFGVERGYIFFLDHEGNTVSNTHEWCETGVKTLKPKYQNFPVEQFRFIKDFTDKRIDHLYFGDVSNAPPEYENFKNILIADDTVAVLLMPLLRDGQVFGIFGYDCLKTTHNWTSEEISLLRVIGEIFSNAIARKEAEHQRIIIEAHRQQSENSNSLAKLAEAVAHQFNNQLQIVIGNLELLKTDNEDRQKKKHNDAMKAAIKAAELSAMLMAYLGETHGQSLEDKILEQKRHSETLPRQLEGGYILVVEDDQMVRFITTSMLQHFNFKVLDAHDGAEALQILAEKEDSIRLIICDLILPGLDGWQILAEIRKSQPSLPFILASGYDDAMALKGNHNLLPQAFLRKPFNAANLQEAIRLALSS